MLAGLALVAQVAVLFVMVNEFTAHFDYFYWFCIFVSFLATVWIVSDRSEPGYKIAWLVVILPFPVFGGILYLLLGGNRISERTRRKMKGIAERSNEVLRGDFKADRLTHLDEDAVGQIRYLERYASCPVSLSLREVGHWTTTFSSPSRSLRSASREGCIIQYPLDCFRISW